MLMDPNNNHPAFSKLLEQGFIDKIRMPAAFVKEHKKMMAKTVLLKTDEGLSWEAKIVREASDYFICEGDWPRFVLHHKLELGDLLIFFLIDKSTFQVLFYSKKSLTNFLDFEELSSSDEEEVEDGEENTEAARRSKKVKMETVHLSEKRVDPPGGSKGGGNPCYSRLAPATKKANEVKMEQVILSSGSKDGGNPCFSHPGGKSHAKADNMLGMKKKAPKTKEEKKAFVELIELSDSEEKTGDSCYSHTGGKSNAKADNMLGVKKKALKTKEAKKVARDPDKPRRPAGAFFIFMNEFRKQFKDENPKTKTMAAIGIAGGEKWRQLSNAEKAPYVEEAKKWMVDYYKNKDAYNKQPAAGASAEEESYKSLFEVD